MYINRIPFAIGALTCAMLSACGGGGGGSGTTAGSGTQTPAAPSPSETEVAITSGNTNQVASLGHLVVSSGFALSADTGETLVGAELSSGQTALSPGLVNLALSTLDRALKIATRTSTNTAVGAVTDTETVNCSGSGNYVITIESANTETLSAGDKTNIRFNNCVEEGNSLNGNVSTVLDQVSGNSESNREIKATIQFTDAKSGTPSQDTIINGVTQAYRKADGIIRGSGWVKSDNLTYDIQRGGAKGTLKSSGLEITFIQDYSNTRYGITQTVSASFPALKGRFAITTPEPLVQNPDGIFESGSINLAGAGSKLVLRYQLPSPNSTPLVRILPDTNDDGIADKEIATSYDALLGPLW